MSHQPINLTPPNNLFRTVLRDEDGTIILEIIAGESLLTEPDGSITHIHDNTSIKLVDGPLWYPGKPNVDVGVCSFCRKPPWKFPVRDKPTHGIVSLPNTKHCTCGKLLCPRHTHNSTDHKFRCPVCQRKYQFRHTLWFLFTATEETR